MVPMIDGWGSVFAGQGGISQKKFLRDYFGYTPLHTSEYNQVIINKIFIILIRIMLDEHHIATMIT